MRWITLIVVIFVPSFSNAYTCLKSSRPEVLARSKYIFIGKALERNEENAKGKIETLYKGSLKNEVLIFFESFNPVGAHKGKTPIEILTERLQA